MIDRRFVRLFVATTVVLAAAVYFSSQAATHGGTVLTVLAVVAAVVGILGFVVLARVVVFVERQRGQQ